MSNPRHARRREFPNSTETRVIFWVFTTLAVTCPFWPLLPWLR